MPRIARTESEVLKEKNQIMNTALEIVHKEGFAALSMRKIGARVGMTAANIYNYFSNKDELNIELRKIGHIMLYEAMKNAYETGNTFEEKIANAIHAYVSFAINNPYYYELMFMLPTPKYLDYVGTPLEETSRKELQSSMRLVELVVKFVEDYKKEGGTLEAAPTDAFLVFWSQLHGVISLYNNNMLQYVSQDPKKTVEFVVDNLLELISKQLKK